MYRKLAGNIPDVKTVKNLLTDLDILGFKKVKLVMDRGFYSEGNINAMYKEHLKFLVSAKTSLSFELDTVYDDLRTFEHYNEAYQLYSTTVQSTWHYTQEKLYKGDTVEDKRRIYINLYYNIDKAAEDQKNFDKKLMVLKHELLEGKRIPEHENLYAKYFVTKSTPIRGVHFVLASCLTLLHHPLLLSECQIKY
jgi:transposase